MRSGAVVDRLLRSPEPSVRWKVRRQVLGEDPHGRSMSHLSEEVRRSRRVRALLTRRDSWGRPGTARGVYHKWQGGQWILQHLADLGYPVGDAELEPLRDRVVSLWLRSSYYRELDVASRDEIRGRLGVPRLAGRYRRCASQQGNALHAIVRLGLDDDRGKALAERLIHWQWPDGGWNCDLDVAADTSSFQESRLPMIGLAEYGRAHGDRRAVRAARRAAEVFLRRRLYRRVSTGSVIRSDFVRLHYPNYYQYDVLAGLRAMADVGTLQDPRCADALDLLEGKRLRSGGWPAEAARYRYAPYRFGSGCEFVDWGGPSPRRENPWVTVDALGVLRAAGRLEL